MMRSTTITILLAFAVDAQVTRPLQRPFLKPLPVAHPSNPNTWIPSLPSRYLRKPPSARTDKDFELMLEETLPMFKPAKEGEGWGNPIPESERVKLYHITEWDPDECIEYSVDERYRPLFKTEIPEFTEGDCRSQGYTEEGHKRSLWPVGPYPPRSLGPWVDFEILRIPGTRTDDFEEYSKGGPLPAPGSKIDKLFYDPEKGIDSHPFGNWSMEPYRINKPLVKPPKDLLQVEDIPLLYEYQDAMEEIEKEKEDKDQMFPDLEDPMSLGLVAQTFRNVASVSNVAWIGLIAGCSSAFALLYCRYGVSIVGDEPLLASTVDR